VIKLKKGCGNTMKNCAKKYISLFLAIVCSFCFAFSVPVFANENAQATPQTEQAMTGDEAAKYLDAAVLLIMSRYKFDTSRESIYKDTLRTLLKEHPELLETVLESMFGSLDKYSTYYTQEELDSFFNAVSSEFCGIGVIITTVDEGLFVTKVYDNSPAKIAGLMIGDIIIKVDDISLAGVDVSVAQSKIQGPEDTAVNLTIKRGDSCFEINPIRKKVIIEPGFYQAIENDTIGYISLSDFYDHTNDMINAALESFDSKGIKDIIIDLRNNPGGSLKVLVEMCNHFIPAGPVIHLDYKNPFNNYTFYSENPEVKYNLAVLVNGNSASASEAFAAAVKDTRVGIIVGENTFGKGTMQNVVDFKVIGGVKITEAEFLSPNRNKINEIGVAPDVEVEDKVVEYHHSNFEKITYDRVMKPGDTGKDVFAVEERLYYLGFEIGVPDEVFDEKTAEAVFNFQKYTDLYPYGQADITTQLKLEEVLNGGKVTENNTFKKAVEIFKSGTWKNYLPRE